MGDPTVEVHAARGPLRGAALFCHGGTAVSQEPPRDRALSVLRMRAVEEYVRRTAGDRGIATHLLRYRVAGWNGGAADAHADVGWAIERVRAEHGPEVPVVLVGHSMGGRAALRAAGDPQVAAVCALAPWTPPGEPVAHLKGRTITILHGRRDRWVPTELSAAFALRALQAGARVARFTTPGGHSMLRGADIGVVAVAVDQRFVRAALDDRAVVEHDDVIGVFHRRHAVRDDQHRPPLPDRRSACRIRSSVCVSTALSESSRIRISGSRTSARAIAVRCFCPPESVMPRSPMTVSSPCGNVGDVGRRGRPASADVAHLSSLRVGAAEADVLRDRFGEEKRLLRHHADPVAQLAQRNRLDRTSVDEDRAGRRLERAREQREQRRLAAAGAADDADGLAVAHVEVDVAQHGRGRSYANVRSRISRSPRGRRTVGRRPSCDAASG